MEEKLTENRTVIVTGGAGYIGSILVRKLLADNYRVICIDKLDFGGASLLGVWDNPAFTFEQVDINDHPEVDRVIETYREAFAVVHLAAIVGDPACKLHADLARKTNLDSSKHLVKIASKAGIKRFIFASTCSNYGKMPDPDAYVNENSELAPISLYAETKVAVEKFILEEMPKSDSFSPTCLRFATVYGLSPRMRFDLTVNEFTKELALDKELLIFGEQFWRPYCYVGDFSRAIQAVLNNPMEKVAYNVFNVGDTKENYTKKMLADELLNLIPEANIKYVQKNEDPRDYRVNFDKIRDDLGFSISKTVPQAMNEILQSIKFGIIENPEDQRYYNIPVNQ